MAAAIVPLGEKVLGSVGKAVTNDIVVLNGQVFRRVVVQKAHRKSKKYPQGQKEIVQLTPIDLELHVNPLAIGLGALGIAVAGFFAFGRLEIPLPLGGSLQLYEGPLADEWDAWKFRQKDAALERERQKRIRACQSAGGTWDDLQGQCILPDTPVECVSLLNAWNAFVAAGDSGAAYRVKEKAAAQGCAWAQ